MIDFITISNFSYAVLALYMYGQKNPHSTLVLVVFCVSLLHHSFPDKKVLQRFDGTIANISLAIILPYYLIKKHKTWQYWLSIVTFIVALYCYLKSGNDYTKTSYIYYHSFWHILSPLALFIMIQAPNYQYKKINHNKLNQNNLKILSKETICTI